MWRDGQTVETENGLGGILRGSNIVYKDRESGIGNAFLLCNTIYYDNRLCATDCDKQGIGEQNICPEVKDRDTKERATSKRLWANLIVLKINMSSMSVRIGRRERISWRSRVLNFSNEHFRFPIWKQTLSLRYRRHEVINLD